MCCSIITGMIGQHIRAKDCRPLIIRDTMLGIWRLRDDGISLHLLVTSIIHQALPILYINTHHHVYIYIIIIIVITEYEKGSVTSSSSSS